jgi:hypothetical protein
LIPPKDIPQVKYPLLDILLRALKLERNDENRNDYMERLMREYVKYSQGTRGNSRILLPFDT